AGEGRMLPDSPSIIRPFMHYADGVLHIANISALDLARRLGTPPYVYAPPAHRRPLPAPPLRHAALRLRRGSHPAADRARQARLRAAPLPALLRDEGELQPGHPAPRPPARLRRRRRVAGRDLSGQARRLRLRGDLVHLLERERRGPARH